jgi:adenylate cyclase
MSLSLISNCSCANAAHGHGFSCSQLATEPAGLCKACSDAAKGEGIYYVRTGMFNYPVSNVASSIYVTGGLGEGFAGSANPLYNLDQEKVRDLQNEIRRLEDNLKTAANELHKEKVTSAGHMEREAKLNSTLSELEKKQQLAFLLDRVSREAADFLLDSELLGTEFLGSKARPLFAMSVDIRRSTDLMLKARTPQAFATFIMKLCNDLMDVVRNHHGVVDKFTGDGILCFFPEFFSGKDAGYYALSAADACHATFDKHYKAHRNSFTSVLKDVGLGIGVDYGECHLVQVPGNLTIVGSPVVYACRLGGAPAGLTLLNQPAYEIVCERHGGRVLLEETSIEIKHEGILVAYAATLSRSTFAPSPPAWIEMKKSVDGVEKRKSAKKPGG